MSTGEVRHAATVTIREDGADIAMDYHDESLGLRIYFDPVTASKLGQSLLDKARFLVSKDARDPLRQATPDFAAEGKDA